MYRLKSIKLYFFSILKLFFLSFRNFYFRSSYYNKKLISFIPERIFYNPSTFLSASLISTTNDFYKITENSPELLWEVDNKDRQRFENLHSFLWLTKLDRKNNKNITKNIIKSWINKFFDYSPHIWEMEITAKRIIAWSSNSDLIIENSEKIYKEKILSSLVKQANFLSKNLNSLFYGPSKIICCAAILLSGLMFKENDYNYKFGIKELEKFIKNFFDENGFPKSRNPEDVFICLKYLILIREWLKEAQQNIPDFLNEIISKCGSCYMMLSCNNKQFPLFNGATEINYNDYDIFLKTLKYKFSKKNIEAAGFVKINKKKIDFFMDCGNPPPGNFSKDYQAGCLSFELVSNKNKIICNTGYGKYLSSKLTTLSRSTAAHSTLYLNDTSSCVFQKNKFINEIYGNSLLQKHRVISKNYTEDKDFCSITASHNGYENAFGYIHTRLVKFDKKSDKVIGYDELKKTKKYTGNIIYFIRFHIYPNTKIVKTKAENSILLSLSNGEGWLLKTEMNKFKIEKNIFLGNKNKILNNDSVLISGVLNKELFSIKWILERAK